MDEEHTCGTINNKHLSCVHRKTKPPDQKVQLQPFGGRVTGMGQITWRIVLTKKMRGHLLHRHQEIASEWVVRVWVHRDSWLGAQIGTRSETKYKHSKIVFTVTSIALSLGHIGLKLLGLAAQSLSGSPGTLHGGRVQGLPIRDCAESHKKLCQQLRSSSKVFQDERNQIAFQGVPRWAHVYTLVTPCSRVFISIFIRDVPWETQRDGERWVHWNWKRVQPGMVSGALDAEW